MTDHHDNEDVLTSDSLARFVIDALLRAGIVQETDVPDAVAIAAEEIGIRHLSGELSYS